jgi:hypothetical protein
VLGPAVPPVLWPPVPAAFCPPVPDGGELSPELLQPRIAGTASKQARINQVVVFILKNP